MPLVQVLLVNPLMLWMYPGSNTDFRLSSNSWFPLWPSGRDFGKNAWQRRQWHLKLELELSHTYQSYGVGVASTCLQSVLCLFPYLSNGVACLIDDTLIFGKSQEGHDTRLRAALQHLVPRSEFIGHILETAMAS